MNRVSIFGSLAILSLLVLIAVFALGSNNNSYFQVSNPDKKILDSNSRIKGISFPDEVESKQSKDLETKRDTKRDKAAQSSDVYPAVEDEKSVGMSSKIAARKIKQRNQNQQNIRESSLKIRSSFLDKFSLPRLPNNSSSTMSDDELHQFAMRFYSSYLTNRVSDEQLVSISEVLLRESDASPAIRNLQLRFQASLQERRPAKQIPALRKLEDTGKSNRKPMVERNTEKNIRAQNQKKALRQKFAQVVTRHLVKYLLENNIKG